MQFNDLNLVIQVLTHWLHTESSVNRGNVPVEHSICVWCIVESRCVNTLRFLPNHRVCLCKVLKMTQYQQILCYINDTLTQSATTAVDSQVALALFFNTIYSMLYLELSLWKNIWLCHLLFSCKVFSRLWEWRIRVGCVVAQVLSELLKQKVTWTPCCLWGRLVLNTEDRVWLETWPPTELKRKTEHCVCACACACVCVCARACACACVCVWRRAAKRFPVAFLMHFNTWQAILIPALTSNTS